MARLEITLFSGEQPRILPQILADTGAQEAWNIRFDDGGLSPTRASLKAGNVTAGHRSIYRHNGTWISREGDVSFAPGPVAQDRLYYMDDERPKMMVAGAIYPLAVPRPANALTATLSGTGTGDKYTRLYVTTWVTEFGEESEPSPISAEVTWQAGQAVTLSGFSTVPTGRAITKQRIYRSQTGSVGTYLYFIAERVASNADFTDNVAVNTFAEPLPSTDWTAPPDSLRGLVSMANGMMAAFSGRDIYFCEPWRPHAWPEKYVMTVDWPVVGLAAIGSSLLVMTAGQPYLIAGQHPSVMAQTRVELNLPCINARGIVNLGTSICYPTHDGLVLINPSGGAGVITQNLFNRETWLSFSPQTAVASQYAGRYVFFYDTIDPATGDRKAGAFAIDTAGQTPFLARLSIQAAAAWYDVTTSSLYYCLPQSSEVLEFSPTTGAPQTLIWRSKLFLQPWPLNFGIILVDTNSALLDVSALLEQRQQVLDEMAAALALDANLHAPLNEDEFNNQTIAGDIYIERLAALPLTESFEISVMADKKLVFTTSRHDKPIRMKAGFTARSWEVIVRSNISVAKVILASTMADLKA